MKTIAVTIDEAMLRTIDRLLAKPGKGKRKRGNRSHLVRIALAELLARMARSEREEAEWKTWCRHLEQINRQAAALVSEQAEA